MAIIYWIHKANNEDYLTEGYVGISKNSIEERTLQHKYNTNTHLKNAFNKYGFNNLVKEVIFEGNIKECQLFEEYLRPHKQIGWNIEKGGGLPPSNKGKKRKESTKIKISKAVSGSKNGMYGKSGELNHFFGKKHNTESLKKISENKPSVSGKSNPKYDNTIYIFKHEDIGVVESTRFDLINKYNLHNGNMSLMIKGSLKCHKGWVLISKKTP